MKRFVTWADINYIHEPGSYNFQDGILDIEQAHLDAERSEGFAARPA